MNIGVIGAGWYGCHLASFLLKKGHDVTVFEKDGVFAGASGHNQDRVHLGFHYPRSAKTRAEIRHCHDRFVDAYPTVGIVDNVYAVAVDSSIDFETYKAICRCSDLSYRHAEPEKYGLVGVEGCVLTRERVVDTRSVVEMFRREVGRLVRTVEIEGVHQLGDRVGLRAGGTQYNFDAVVNCTNLRTAAPALPVYYEAALVMEADGPKGHPSLTVMDGPFPTILATPTPGKYTVSHVTCTSLAKMDTFAKAQEVLDSTKWEDVADKFAFHVSRYYPAFGRNFTFTGARAAVRTKPVNGTDSRECITNAAGRVMTVSCGKFMSVFIAEERVEKWLHSLSDTPASSGPTS